MLTPAPQPVAQPYPPFPEDSERRRGSRGGGVLPPSAALAAVDMAALTGRVTAGDTHCSPPPLTQPTTRFAFGMSADSV